MRRICAFLFFQLLVITLSVAGCMHSARADDESAERPDEKPLTPAEVQERAYSEAQQEAAKAAHQFKFGQEQMKALTFKLKADAEQKAAEQVEGMRQELEEAKRQLAQRQQQLEQAAKELAKQQREVSMPDLPEGELKIFRLKYLPAGSAANAIETRRRPSSSPPPSSSRWPTTSWPTKCWSIRWCTRSMIGEASGSSSEAMPSIVSAISSPPTPSRISGPCT